MTVQQLMDCLAEMPPHVLVMVGKRGSDGSDKVYLKADVVDAITIKTPEHDDMKIVFVGEA